MDGASDGTMRPAPVEAFVFDAYGTLFDPASVTAAVEEAFPGRGAFVSAVWRQKQLEYSWQRTAMGFHAGFDVLTRDALAYAIRTVQPTVRPDVVDALCAAFDRLALFPDARDLLDGLDGKRLAILSNGSRGMLARLLGRAGIADRFEAVVSSDDVRAFKPNPDLYRAIAARLVLEPGAIALVSGNGFDLAGARRFGLTTVRMERLAADRLRLEVGEGAAGAAFAALRTQMDDFAGEPDFTCSSLAELGRRIRSGEIATSRA